MSAAVVEEVRHTFVRADDDPVFAGHFPALPVLPGYAQLAQEVLPLVRATWDDLGPLRAIRRLRFTAPVRPGVSVEVVARRRTGAAVVEFTLQGTASRHASGVLDFAPTAAP